MIRNREKIFPHFSEYLSSLPQVLKMLSLSLFFFFSFFCSVVVLWVPVLCFYEMDIFVVGFVSEGKPTQTQTKKERGGYI